MKPTLIILAAGMASRYGSMKQTEGFGPAGETIMDYSIYDAIRAGFEKVVFIIREDFAENFKASFEPKLSGKIKTEYVYQSLDRYLDGYAMPADRVKPWGTGHAMLCASDAVMDPFIVINADDFYGSDAFRKAFDFIITQCNEKTAAIIGYELRKTLSDFGTVSRGVVASDDKGNMTEVVERTKIARDNEGRIYNSDPGNEIYIDEMSPVSMNFWAFHPSIFELTKKYFETFLKEQGQELKSEFFIPIVADKFIHEEGGVIKVIPTSSDWFGVTYKEDAPSVKSRLNALIEKGDYPNNLWGV